MNSTTRGKNDYTRNSTRAGDLRHCLPHLHPPSLGAMMGGIISFFEILGVVFAELSLSLALTLAVVPKDHPLIGFVWILNFIGVVTLTSKLKSSKQD